ncbi:hypothetical protein [Neopusillimonas aromaticivorans]|uniref:hypothetical protein n=1 Tax=Neopusillimonas aromaticivorans TaxID=2979868 RepID=UPI0025925230|nr:hypothetical protein [Neopusillimonas aromaticivorans]NLZ11245.1 hypothetical protein [Alcaligenaceae bacterium]WJJ92886.1 hypothetical protein N7E01_11815 [Neopusillimonas aromaticivorans]
MNHHVFIVPADHRCLQGHFPGNPVVPGVLLLSEVLTGLGANIKAKPITIKSARFTAQLLPNEQARVSYKIKDKSIRYEVTVLRDATTVAIASGSLTTRLDESSQ